MIINVFIMIVNVFIMIINVFIMIIVRKEIFANIISAIKCYYDMGK